MSPFEVRVLPLAELKPAPYHPRRALAPRSRAYRTLRGSLAAFGLVEPLVWNEPTGHVIGGVARLRALADLGYSQVPVSVVRLPEARAKALGVVLDNPKAQGRYDPGKLADLLGDLERAPELALTGFDRGVLRCLRLEPVAGADPAPAERRDRVEVTLVVNEGSYPTLAPELDMLIGKFDLVAHVRHGA